jgi:hypothetical protein
MNSPCNFVSAAAAFFASAHVDAYMNAVTTVAR